MCRSAAAADGSSPECWEAAFSLKADVFGTAGARLELLVPPLAAVRGPRSLAPLLPTAPPPRRNNTF